MVDNGLPLVIVEPILGSACGDESPSEEITILESRRRFSDEQLLDFIRKDGRHANKDESKLLRKLRFYFRSVIQSQVLSNSIPSV